MGGRRHTTKGKSTRSAVAAGSENQHQLTEGIAPLLASRNLMGNYYGEALSSSSLAGQIAMAKSNGHVKTLSSAKITKLLGQRRWCIFLGFGGRRGGEWGRAACLVYVKHGSLSERAAFCEGVRVPQYKDCASWPQHVTAAPGSFFFPSRASHLPETSEDLKCQDRDRANASWLLLCIT